jgi:phosphohistidine phosphatase
MQAYLVHHADAVGPEIDSQRPLSAHGHTQAEWLAEQAKAAGFTPPVIWHSGKLRSRQTAEAFLRHCNPFADFKMVRGLAPDDPTGWMLHELNAIPSDVLVVGHMPQIAALLSSLDPDAAPFPLHGFVVLERATHGGWLERWRAKAP